ncbi:hypothetical protein ACIRSU_03670 [Streptomyces sp. NPDC101160]|uniref:hypothetical protein n=1 Tax=Streptomyces sp. NPDC101160 TaxID=3366118 RepID=UPI003810A351
MNQVYQHNRVITRPVPGEHSLLVYTEDQPNVFLLNTKTWLIFALCDGATHQEVADQFVSAVAATQTKDQALGDLEEGLNQLEQKGLVRRISTTTSTTGTT